MLSQSHGGAFESFRFPTCSQAKVPVGAAPWKDGFEEYLRAHTLHSYKRPVSPHLAAQEEGIGQAALQRPLPHSFVSKQQHLPTDGLIFQWCLL